MWGVVIGQEGTANVSMPRAVYDRFRGKPLMLELTLAVAEGREQGSARIPLSPSGVAAVGDGICRATSTSFAGATSNLQNVATVCLYPLRQPQLTQISLQWLNQACNPAGANRFRGGSWSGLLDRQAAYFSINPISIGPSVNDGVSYAASKDGLPAECPASQVMIAQYELAARTQATVTIPNFQLPSLSPESGH
jgi:hypothetical protein